MKGLNIKRVVALGLGAALIGSALAPVISAANVVPTGLDKLTKADIVSDAGVPVVDVVVGSQAAVSDVVWAGNIAAKVAQLATVPASGAVVSTDKSVDVTIGGTQTTSGAGNTDENYVAADTALEFNPIKATITDVPTFATGSLKLKHPAYGSTSYQDVSVDENAWVISDVTLQTDADKNLAGQTVQEINSGAINYLVSFGGLGIPYSAADQTQLDSNSNVDLQIPMLGKKYVVSEIRANGASMVLYESTAPTTLNVGETVSVEGAGNYAGKMLTVSLDNLYKISDAGHYYATWTIKDGNTGAAIKTINSSKDAPYDLKDEFGSSYMKSSVYISNVALNLSSNKYYAAIRTGTQRIEIKNNDVFPYDSTVNSVNKLWKATILTDGTSKITGIKVWNDKLQYLKSDLSSLKATEGRMGPLAAGQEVMIPSDAAYLKYKFVGMQTKKMSTNTIGNEKLSITDTKGVVREVPLVSSQLSNNANTVTIGGKTFSIDINESNYPATLKYWDRVVDDTTTATGFTQVTLRDNNIALAAPVDFAIDSDWKNTVTGKVRYYVGGSKATHKYYLFLAAQSFDVASTNDTPNGEITFSGMDVNQDSTGATMGIDLGFYMPDKQTFTFLDANLSTAAYGSATVTSNEGDNFIRTAVFKFNEKSTVAPVTSDVNVYIDAASGNLINTTDNKSKAWSTNEVATQYGWNLNANTTAASSKLIAAGTPQGSELMDASGVLTIKMPVESRKAESYLGSLATTTTSVGGESFTGMAAGSSKTTTAGTTVTVDAITAAGGASGPAVSVVKVGKLVKTDADGYGKAIIVGGWMVNTAANNLQVANGQTLNDMIVNSGDYVAAVLDSGNIVVAGMTAADTGAAAQALISALEAM